MNINRIIFCAFISLMVNVSSCASTGGGARKVDLTNPDLDNPYLVSGVPSDKGKFERRLDSHKTNHKLVYIDTRPVELYRGDILKGIQSARNFGRNIGKNNVLFVPKVLSPRTLRNFSRKSKDFHDNYIGNKHSYKQAPFLVAFDGHSAKHIVPLTELSHECRVRFLSDLEQSVRTNVFNEKVKKNYYSAIDIVLCETPEAIDNVSHIEKIIRFLKSAFL